MTEEATPHDIMTMAGPMRVLIREGRIAEAKKLIAELKASKKRLAKFLHDMTEPERFMLADDLGMSEKELYYTHGEGSL